MADYAISNVPRRVVYAPSGVGPYAFTFEILSQTDIAVYKASTLLTLTTDYTVTINANGTGSVTLVTTAGTSNITIVGAKNIQRTTDFTTGGDLFANTLNDELDNQTIFIQQVAETAERGLKAPVTDPTDINMTLPSRTSRAGKYLAFDSNGNPQPGPTSSDVSGVAAISDDIVIVAGIASNVTTVAGISANVTTVATNSGNVNTVSSNIANVNTTATNIANVNAVGADLLEAESEINTVATNITNVNSVGTSIASVNSVAAELGAGQDVTVVAANLSGADTIGTVATNIANVNATGTNIANVNAVGSDLLEAVSEINTVATDITNVNTVGNNIANVNTVAGISSNVTTVAGISANVTSVAGNSTNINAVAGNATNINAVNSNSTNINAVNSNATNINTVAGISANVTTVATNNTNVSTVATNIASVNTNATNIVAIQNASTNATNAANSATAAGNAQTAAEAARDATLAAYDNFDDRYLGSKTSDPTLDNDGNALVAGALYFNSTDVVMKVYTGSAWVAAYVSGTGFLSASNNLSDVANAGTARTNLGLAIGTNVQAYDADLATIAGLTPTNQYAIIGNGTSWTSAALPATGVTSVTGTSPVASSGGATPAISLASGYGDTQNPYASKTANFVLAAPNGSSGAPTFRAVVAADIPTLNQNTTGTAANVTGTVAIANGGTGQTTANAGYNALSPMTTTGDITYEASGGIATRLPIGTAGQVLTVTSGLPAWASAGGGGGTTIPAGTVMLFYQAAAPTGFTQVTTQNNKALRVVSGTGGGTGGTTAFTTVFTNQTPTISGSFTVGATTLSTSQMPSHNHQTTGYNGGSNFCTSIPGWGPVAGCGSVMVTSSTGGGGSHTHSISGSPTSSAITLDVQYIDIILASKD
jgi:hypothetical protein